MNKLYNLVTEFINKLDNEECIINLKESYNDIKKDEELNNKIKKYKETYNKSLLNEIEEDELYKKMKKYEAELGYIILEINNKLKEISNKGTCL